MKGYLRFTSTAVALALCFPATGWTQNLVINGGFEDGHEGWSGGEVVPDDPHAGTSCLRIVDGSDVSNIEAHVIGLIPIVQGHAYEFEVWIRGQQDGQETLVAVNQHEASGDWIWGNNMDFVVTASTGWTRMHRVIRGFHPDTAYVRIVLYPVRWTETGERTGTAWFDDVRFEETSYVGPVQGHWVVDEGSVHLWQSPVEQKVSRDAVLDPEASLQPEIRISAARGEVEPFQLVLLLAEDVAEEWLTGVSVTAMAGPAETVIEPAAVSIHEVAYIEVVVPTDFASIVGWRPDPLPVLETPLALDATWQQPLWFSLEVPAGIPPGDYVGSIQLEFSLAEALEVPLRVHVWDFDLPPERHFQTAYGLSLHLIDRYHHLGGDRDKRRQVLRLYLQDFARHRINPYNPLGDDGYTVAFPNFNWSDPDALILPDPDSVTENRVLQVTDERTDSPVAVQTSLAIPVDTGGDYLLSWRVKIDERLDGDDYLVAVNQYDADDQWIPHFNLDHVRYGTADWQSESVPISHTTFNDQTSAVRISLFARQWTEPGQFTGTAWFDDLSFTSASGGENLVVNGDFDLPVDQIQIDTDFSRFDIAAAHAFDDLGLDGFRLDLYRFASCSWSSTYQGSLLGYPWGTPDYEALFTRLLQAVTDHLSDRGWLELAYAYPFDEPNPSQIPLVVEGMELIHTAEPRLRRLLTKPALPELIGSVDIWVPLISDHDPDWASERQAAGEEVWWYVCTGPRAPYPNNFIDHLGIEHRIRFWMAFVYSIQGSLYWETNYWTNDAVFEPPDYQDPWVDPQSYYYYDDRVGTWGNGDGRLLYPPRDWSDGTERIEGPTPSLRWELLREGIEDYEYFWLLREAADQLEIQHADSDLLERARALLDIPDTILASTFQYTEDPDLLQEHRYQVAATLEEILDALSVVEEGDDSPEDAGTDLGDPSPDLGQDLPWDVDMEDRPDTGTDPEQDLAEGDPLEGDPATDGSPDMHTEVDADQPWDLDAADGPSADEDPGATAGVDGGCGCTTPCSSSSGMIGFWLCLAIGLGSRRMKKILQ